MSSASGPGAPVGNEGRQEVVVISHSPLFYWWPVWAVGYVMAFLTWFNGGAVSFGNHTELVAQAGWIGVVFTVVLFLVILMW